MNRCLEQSGGACYNHRAFGTIPPRLCGRPGNFPGPFAFRQIRPVGGRPGTVSRCLSPWRRMLGNWSVTVGPVIGFHYYWFNVDGVVMNDPGSETFFGYNKETSGIEIPDPQYISTDLTIDPIPTFYAPHEGPHGQLQEQWYRSAITGDWRRCFVYTPPGYYDAANSGTRYPFCICSTEPEKTRPDGAGRARSTSSWTI